MDYAVNALFFNDETMHKIYVDKGLFDWETQIPITIYSFLISTILNIPLPFLGLSNDKIIEFKQNQTKQGIKKQRTKLIFCLKIKFVFYFILNLYLLYNISNMHLYFSIFAQFLIIYIILNGCYEINYMNLFDYYNELILYSKIFLILLNNMHIIKFIELNKNKACKGKEEKKRVEDTFLTDKQRVLAQNYSSKYGNFLFEHNNITTNTCELIDNEIIKNDNNIFIKKQRKKRYKFLIRNINHLRNFIEIIKYIILLYIFNNIFVNNKISLIEYNSYNITLKIKGNGTKNIFDSLHFSSEYYPNEVYINGDKQTCDTTYRYNLNQTDNVIGLIWYNLISGCDNMFNHCFDITDIDLSNFNTSNVTTMESMFNGLFIIDLIKFIKF